MEQLVSENPALAIIVIGVCCFILGMFVAYATLSPLFDNATERAEKAESANKILRDRLNVTLSDSKALSNILNDRRRRRELLARLGIEDDKYIPVPEQLLLQKIAEAKAAVLDESNLPKDFVCLSNLAEYVEGTSAILFEPKINRPG